MSMMEAINILHETGGLYVFAFAIGASVGSFLNVVIHRWPREESLVRPGSHCPHCRHPIPWFLNLPVVSYLFLRGKCRWCGGGISAQYVLIEIAGGLWGVFCLYRFGVTVPSLFCFVIGSGLLAAGVIDALHRLLPDAITLGLIPLGAALALFPEAWAPAWPVSFLESVIGALLGGGLLWAVMFGFKRLTGREGMGLGDVKLLAGLGAWLGYPALPPMLLFASVSGLLFWIVLAVLNKADRGYEVPFGTFLAGASLMVVMLWNQLEDLYMIVHWF